MFDQSFGHKAHVSAQLGRNDSAEQNESEALKLATQGQEKAEKTQETQKGLRLRS